MKFRIFKFIALPLILIGTSVIILASRNNDDNLRRELLVKVIAFAVENGHYHSGNIDDDFSEKVFDLYIERLDFGKRFLLEGDINNLSRYKYKIDDEFNAVTFDFLDGSIELINLRTNDVQTYYREILAQTFDFENLRVLISS